MSVYVLDTHALLLHWFRPWSFERLGRLVLELGERCEVELVVPTMAIIEALRQVSRYSRGRMTQGEFIEDVTSRPQFRIEPLGLDQVRLLPGLEAVRELHDRIIVAHAVALNAPLLTPDDQIRAAGIVETLW